MNEKHSHIDYKLIGRYLDGTANATEIDSVESWIASAPVNRLEFLRLEKLWNESGRILPHESAEVDVDAGWSSLTGRLRDTGHWNDAGTGIRSLSKKTYPIFSMLYRVAAVLVVGLLIYFIYDSVLKKPKSFDLVAENTVQENTLPDGSIVTLNTDTRVSYPEEFRKNKRQVNLTGEAFFKVEKNPEKPFIVETKDALIRVLGTSFNVKARDAEGVVEVSVEEGRVELMSKDGSKSVILTAGEKGRLDVVRQLIEEVEKVDPDAFYWVSKTIVFRNTELSVVFETLKDNYNSKIEFAKEQKLDCHITGIFEDYTIDEILEHVAESCGLEVKKEGDKYLISRRP